MECARNRRSFQSFACIVSVYALNKLETGSTEFEPCRALAALGSHYGRPCGFELHRSLGVGTFRMEIGFAPGPKKDYLFSF